MSPSLYNPSRRQGVALVITLILLSAILVVTVALLALSRRERSSVTTAQHLIDAELMANAGAERARAMLAAQILGRTNMAAGGYARAVFMREAGPTDNDNPLLGRIGGNLLVSTSTNSIVAADYTEDYIGKLRLDARPPVFVTTNSPNPNAPRDFRLFLDLNRNGMFESNGYFAALDATGQVAGTNRLFHAGDPEWIGVLQYPSRPHSGSNRFTGRYAFLVVPAGRTLDLNTAHNNAKNAGVDLEGYGRNQGVGAFELNLAAYFADLNTNLWGRRTPNDYVFDRQAPDGLGNGIDPGRGQGRAFDVARSILRYRANNRQLSLPSLNSWLGPDRALRATQFFQEDQADNYADDLQIDILNRVQGSPVFDGDPVNVVNARWPGVDATNRFQSFNDLFKPGSRNPNLPPYLGTLGDDIRAISQQPDTYNRYTFYRLLSSLGTDTGSRADGRLHLNLKNTDGYVAGDFVRWNSTNFFATVGDRLFKTFLGQGEPGDGISDNIAVYHSLTGGPVRVRAPGQQYLYARDLAEFRNLSVTNIPLYPTNYYNATVHRLLQMTANLYEPTSTNVSHVVGAPAGHPATHLPTIYIPIFERDGNHLRIAGYREDDGSAVLNRKWVTLDQMANSGISLDQNVYGVPPIVAARKGFPSLNEVTLSSTFEIARKVLITKNAVSDNNQITPPKSIHEMYLLSCSNFFGVELLNAYYANSNPYPRKLRVEVFGTNRLGLYNVSATGAATNKNLLQAGAQWGFRGTNSLPANSWFGGLYRPEALRVGVSNQLTSLSNSMYNPAANTFTRVDPKSLSYPAGSENQFAAPGFIFRCTNELACIIVDEGVSPERVVDVVSMSRLESYFNLGQLMYGNTDSQDTGGATIAANNVWDTNRLGGSSSLSAATRGVESQIRISRNSALVPDNVWANVKPGPTKESESQNFRAFWDGLQSNTNLQKQAPFTASGRFLQVVSWQANDPLLHHIPEHMLNYANGGSGTNYGMPEGKSWRVGVALDSVLDVRSKTFMKPNNSHLRWGQGLAGTLVDGQVNNFNPAIKDPLVRTPDDWDFPTNAYPNLGAIGRVHRGTPWQTVFLKSTNAPLPQWVQHVGSENLRGWKDVSADRVSAYNHPTNDWSLVGLFTTAVGDNAEAGTIGVNQDSLAAWSAVLSGVTVLTNAGKLGDLAVAFDRFKTAAENYKAAPFPLAAPGIIVAQPARDLLNSPVGRIVNGINIARANSTNGLFQSVGELLAVPELTMDSPFLTTGPQDAYREKTISEEMYERIPRQILSLIRTDQPRFVVYAFGQSLRPAADSLVKNPTSPYYDLCLNYQIMAEAATKTVIRFDNVGPAPSSSPLVKRQIQLRPVVESFEVLPQDDL